MPKSAPTPSEKLTDAATLNLTITVLKRHFNLSAEGYVCQTDDLYRVLVHAAAHCSTIEAACADLQDAPDSNTVRGYLQTQLTPADIRTLEHTCNRALYSQWPHWLWSQALNVAADLHDECYYGESDDNAPSTWVCRGEKRNGTTHFYRCATLTTIRNRTRLTLAVVFVHPGEHLVDVLAKLLQVVHQRGLHLNCLYADKQFCSIPVLRYLKRQSFAVLVAAPRKGKAGGINGLCHGQHSYRTDHTFESDEYGTLTVPVGIVRAFKTEHGQRKGTWLAYVLLRITAPLRWVREAYRRRFGIDTSYRLMEQVRARTTSTNPALRFFLMGLALLLVNVWMALQWRYCRVRGTGPRRLAQGHLTLERLARFLIHAIEAHYGVVTAISSP